MIRTPEGLIKINIKYQDSLSTEKVFHVNRFINSFKNSRGKKKTQQISEQIFLTMDSKNYRVLCILFVWCEWF